MYIQFLASSCDWMSTFSAYSTGATSTWKEDADGTMGECRQPMHLYRLFVSSCFFLTDHEGIKASVCIKWIACWRVSKPLSDVGIEAAVGWVCGGKGKLCFGLKLIIFEELRRRLMYGTIVAMLKNNTTRNKQHVLLPSQTLSLYNKVTQLPPVFPSKFLQPLDGFVT